MFIRGSQNLDELFEEVKEYDLVLTVDLSLADALNSRIEEPILGHFAITPKRLVCSEQPSLLDRKDLFEKITQETDISWKQAIHLLDLIIDCWKHTGKLESIYDFERFVDDDTEEIVAILKESDNIFSAMNDYNISPDDTVAVINHYQFDELDKKVLPNDFDNIVSFNNTKFELPEFKVFSSATGIVQAIKNNITEKNANDVAIVVDPESSYESLIKSKLEVNGIEYMGKYDFSDDMSFRTFIRSLRLAQGSDRLLVRELRPLFSFFDVNVSVKYNDEFVSDIDHEELQSFVSFLDSAFSATFERAITKFEEETGEEIPKIREILEDVNLLRKNVTEKRVDLIEYYLNSFEIPLEDNERGVLLASPKKVTFIDRPVVFYVGIDDDWSIDIPKRPWIDESKERELNLKNFELLLQNGERQYYLVQDKFMGEKVTPALYFNEFLDMDFDSFSDLDHSRFEGVEDPIEAGFDRAEEDYAKPEKEEMISQTSLNKLVRCPREYFFEKLVTSIDKDFFKKGNLYHDFAEFCVNYRDFVKTKGIDDFVEIMVTEIKPHVADIRLDYLRTEFRIGAKNILEYIEKEEVRVAEFEGYDEADNDNIFAKYFDKKIFAKNTEACFDDIDLGCEGKIDLIKDETHLVDFKSGRYKTPHLVVKNSNIELVSDYPNFQAIMYLAYHRKHYPARKLKFTFYHFLNNIGDVVSGDEDIEDNKSTVVYYPRLFSEQIRTLEMFNKLKAGVSESNLRRKTLEKLGYSCYLQFFEGREIPHQFDRDKLLESDLALDFIKFCKDKIGDYKYVERGCRSVLKKFNYFRVSNYFKEDIDAFESFLASELDNLNEYKRTRFPIGDINLEKINNRDLILI